MNAPTFKAEALSSSAVEVLGQLFVKGPTWDGNICSKVGRGDLCQKGLAVHAFGWAFLTEEGVRVAIEWSNDDLRRWHDKQWYNKKNCKD